MKCHTYQYNPDETSYKDKVAYDTQDEAIEVAKKINAKPHQIHKVVPYKCPMCHKWHLGKTKTLVKSGQRLLRLLRKQ